MCKPFLWLFGRSNTDLVLSDLQWLLGGVVTVSSDEVLEQKLGVSEVAAVVPERLSVASDERLLEVGAVPDPLLHVVALEKWLSLLHELVGAHLHVLVEQVASQHLLSVLGVQDLRVDEGVARDALGDELEILVVEELIVVVQEEEGHHRHIHHVLLVQWVVHIQISHVVVPLWIVGVEEQSVEWELWTNSLANIKQVKHLLN